MKLKNANKPLIFILAVMSIFVIIGLKNCKNAKIRSQATYDTIEVEYPLYIDSIK